jgi:tRNA-dihydrouridine synthase A
VQGGHFGACLMAEPATVAACVAAMRSAVAIPVTVKCRIGIDDQDTEADFERFIRTVADAGCDTFIVHARKAWLQGLSPKENREIPPLDYARVYRLKAAHPQLTIVLNGGINDLDAAMAHLAHVDGVMLGRAAYQMPWLLAEVDARLFGAPRQPDFDRAGALRRLLPHAARHVAGGGRLNNIARHVLGLYHGEPGGRAFRRHLSEQAGRPGAGVEVLEAAIEIAETARHHALTRARERALGAGATP